MTEQPRRVRVTLESRIGAQARLPPKNKTLRGVRQLNPPVNCRNSPVEAPANAAASRVSRGASAANGAGQPEHFVQQNEVFARAHDQRFHTAARR